MDKRTLKGNKVSTKTSMYFVHSRCHGKDVFIHSFSTCCVGSTKCRAKKKKKRLGSAAGEFTEQPGR